MTRPYPTLAFALSLLAAVPLLAGRPELEQVEVFQAGEGGYHTYRIPAIVATKNGTLLAFCEGRRSSGSDTGDIDLLVKRSFDKGRTWSKMAVVADLGADTVGNPAPVVDRKTGAILLLFTRNPGHVTEKQIVSAAVDETRTVWITASRDGGVTWSVPREITSSVKRPDWTWYATGPGNGIQLCNGRLVIPCDHTVKGTKAMHSHVIYSDDRGATWSIGGVAGDKTNESAVAELRDGSLLFNMRSYHGANRRAIAMSADGGLTWGPTTLDDALIDPVCQGSLVRAVPAARKKGDGRLLFSNAASTKRERMTVRLSSDDGKTWPVARVIHEGPAAYSSLVVLPDRSVGLLYERGDRRPYERITFGRFSLDWLAGKGAF